MIAGFKSVLVLAPHTDDGELGAGGAIAKFTEQGVPVYYAAFSTAAASVPAGWPKDVLKTEVIEATKQLGIPHEQVFVFDYEVRKLNYVRQEILERLIKIKQDHSFDLILMPSLNDIHQDHVTIAQEGLRAFKGTTILGYELIWNNLTFNTTAFFELSEHHVRQKINSLKEYKSQSGRDYMSEEFIFSLARTRGVQLGVKFAEVFEVVRWVIK